MNIAYMCIKNTFHVDPILSTVGNEVFSTAGIAQLIIEVFFFSFNLSAVLIYLGTMCLEIE